MTRSIVTIPLLLSLALRRHVQLGARRRLLRLTSAENRRHAHPGGAPPPARITSSRARLPGGGSVSVTVVPLTRHHCSGLPSSEQRPRGAPRRGWAHATTSGLSRPNTITSIVPTR